jgi:hypothetical protein
MSIFAFTLAPHSGNSPALLQELSSSHAMLQELPCLHAVRTQMLLSTASFALPQSWGAMAVTLLPAKVAQLVLDKVTRDPLTSVKVTST